MPLVTSRAYRCACGHRVFFRNSECLACRAPLGFLADDLAMHALLPGPSAGTWLLHGRDGRYARCGNFATAAACNWLVAIDGAGRRFCPACALNRTIPNLADPENAERWGRLERAKRRLVSQLLGLGLPVTPRSTDPANGLAYDFLRAMPGQPPVTTGHRAGVITIDVDEADEAACEAARKALGEPYRTLLGHFRHEVGHYYWDRLIAGGAWHEPFRELFGDERTDYQESLRRNYGQDRRPDWRDRFISSYASAHPWEDWAESWAHYLHLRDTIDTAASFGLVIGTDRRGDGPFAPHHLWRSDSPSSADFLQLLHDWLEITSVMNEMSRAMGQRDFYPFVLAPRVVPKLHFIHCAIDAAARRIEPRPMSLTA
ncbi:hypothetical protein CDN99_21505 [Roseateles aquatilis]|uniref:Zinc-ribbon domain-containing protein n=1 Tax=Roseateles aquatilis TaxID=431061 RepID=A0A246IZ86_9BURK|nr:putative zinc-binding metallopeptidase [Roseateles aquatilis]OWQ85661.1 hypothetical protein CDN99_21505 [Roseateles aquatilis]